MWGKITCSSKQKFYFQNEKIFTFSLNYSVRRRKLMTSIEYIIRIHINVERNNENFIFSI